MVKIFSRCYAGLIFSAPHPTTRLSRTSRPPSLSFMSIESWNLDTWRLPTTWPHLRHFPYKKRANTVSASNDQVYYCSSAQIAAKLCKSRARRCDFKCCCCCHLFPVTPSTKSCHAPFHLCDCKLLYLQVNAQICNQKPHLCSTNYCSGKVGWMVSLIRQDNNPFFLPQ